MHSVKYYPLYRDAGTDDETMIGAFATEALAEAAIRNPNTECVGGLLILQICETPEDYQWLKDAELREQLMNRLTADEKRALGLDSRTKE